MAKHGQSSQPHVPTSHHPGARVALASAKWTVCLVNQPRDETNDLFSVDQNIVTTAGAPVKTRL